MIPWKNVKCTIWGLLITFWIFPLNPSSPPLLGINVLQLPHHRHQACIDGTKNAQTTFQIRPRTTLYHRRLPSKNSQAFLEFTLLTLFNDTLGHRPFLFSLAVPVSQVNFQKNWKTRILKCISFPLTLCGSLLAMEWLKKSQLLLALASSAAFPK